MTRIHMGKGMFQYFLLFNPPRKITFHTPSIALKLHIRKNPKNIVKYRKTLSPIEEKISIDSQKRVKFADKPHIRSMCVWQFAHSRARKDKWQQAGRDRIRFERKINELDKIISPILKEKFVKFTESSYDRNK